MEVRGVQLDVQATVLKRVIDPDATMPTDDPVAELARHDTNVDGRIDSRDEVWDQLRLLDRTGATRLDDAGFSGIGLVRMHVQGTTSGGDAIDGAVYFERSDCSARMAGDVWLIGRD